MFHVIASFDPGLTDGIEELAWTDVGLGCTELMIDLLQLIGILQVMGDQSNVGYHKYVKTVWRLHQTYASGRRIIT